MNRLRRLAHRFGYDLVPRRKTTDPNAQLAHMLRHEAVDLVLDVGANVGQYALRLREWGYRGRIVSFEPLPDLNEALARKAASDPAWQVAPAMALGDRDGRITLERSAESDMSSALPQSDLLRAISPSSAVLERIEVPLARLDGLAMLREDPASRIHLKIDVQGLEPAVLAGAEGLMDRVHMVQLEMALMPVYENEQPWRHLVDWMDKAGFELGLVIPGYFERKLARQLQFDGIFLRRNDSAPGRLLPVSPATQ